jgi:hypothetical protein
MIGITKSDIFLKKIGYSLLNVLQLSIDHMNKKKERRGGGL